MVQQKSSINLVQTQRNSIRNHSISLLRKQFPLFTATNKQEEENEQVNIDLLKRFQNFLMNQKINKLNTALKKHYGRHYAIPYKPQFGFQQYWQHKKNKFQQYTNILQYFQYPNWYYYLFALLILISKISIIWIVSVHRLYQLSSQSDYGVMVWSLITICFDIILQYHLLHHYDYFRQKNIPGYLLEFWPDIILVMYFISIPFHYQNMKQLLLVLDIFIIAILYKRCQEIKKCFKVEITATSYKNYFNIVQLLTTLLPLAHLFALVLYWVASLNDQKNWLIVHELQNLPPIQKYIYSLYFALTTMLTVGYGDISPVTIAQILIILVIQILGIITYGYIVNQIGHIISHLRKQDQILSRDISTISKMAKYYDLDKNLVQKAKNYLVCQKRQHTDLTIQQQQATLSKLHDQLREQISHQNSLRILKSSLFYVCNWTKRFQIQIAKKVHKKIFSPNQEILQIAGRQRIYIFKKGKVQINANRSSGYKKHFKKILRTIQAKQTMQVSDNIYGYSFIISNTPIKLTAINKQFVVAYYVEKKDFLQTVMDSHLDVEYFHQMKTKIDSAAYPQSWQAPLIINTKQHYFPNIQYLIKRNKCKQSKDINYRSNTIQQRRFRVRSRRVNYQSLEQMQGQIPSLNRNDTLNFNDDLVVYGSTNNLIRTVKTIENIRSATWLSNTVGVGVEQGSFKKQQLHYMFEQGRQFSIYFKRGNKTTILQKLENSNFMLKPTKKSWKQLQA